MFVQTWKKVRHGWLVIRCDIGGQGRRALQRVWVIAQNNPIVVKGIYRYEHSLI